MVKDRPAEQSFLRRFFALPNVLAVGLGLLVFAVTIRLWDSGYRLMPGGRVLYVGQISEEYLVQRFRFFSFWRAESIGEGPRISVREALAEFDQKEVEGGELLIRDRSVNE